LLVITLLYWQLPDSEYLSAENSPGSLKYLLIPGTDWWYLEVNRAVKIETRH